jgi:hypothetical protein
VSWPATASRGVVWESLRPGTGLHMSRRSQEPFRHPAVFYRALDEYVTALVPFAEDGLAAGEPVAVAVPPDNAAVLHAELGQHAEKVRWIDMTVAGRNPGWIIPGCPACLC